MADVRVSSVDVDDTQPRGTAFPIIAHLNNGETLAPPWNPKTGAFGGDRGHKTDITLVIDDEYGRTVVEETKEELVVPRNRVTEIGGSNRRVTFDAALDTAGSYNLRVEASVIREDRTHSSDPVRIDVVDPGDNESSEDVEAGGGDGEDADFNPGANNDNPWGGDQDDDDGTDGGPSLPGLSGSNGLTVALGALALLGVVWIVADLS